MPFWNFLQVDTMNYGLTLEIKESNFFYHCIGICFNLYKFLLKLQTVLLIHHLEPHFLYENPLLERKTYTASTFICSTTKPSPGSKP